MRRRSLSSITCALTAIAAANMLSTLAPCALAAETPASQSPQPTAAAAPTPSSAPVFDETSIVGKRAPRSLNPSRDNQNKADATGTGPDLWRAIISLTLVLALIIAGTYALRYLKIKANRIGRSPGLEIVARTAINTKQSVCLIELGPRLLVVGVSPGHIAALDKIDDPDQIARITGRAATAQPGSISKDFANVFQGESDQYDKPENLQQPPERASAEESQFGPTHNELNSLLDKVKGLRRLCFRPGDGPPQS